MSVASELSALNGHIISAYDEISTMGGIVPQNKNMANLPTAIASIPSGGGGANNNLSSVLDGTTTELYDEDVSSLKEKAMYLYDGREAYITSMRFPNVLSIGGYTFSHQKKLASIYLPRLEKLTGAYQFEYCGVLEEIKLPSLKIIDNANNWTVGTFDRCSAIKKIDFGDNSNTITGNIYTLTFRYCSNLEALILRWGSMIPCGTGAAFANSSIASGTGYIYVPRALVSTYKSASNWSTYANQIRAIEDYSDDGTVNGNITV